MRKNVVFWITAWPAIAMSACATFQPPPSRPPRLETAKACADWRWIGISRPGARCPDIPGWTVRPLFAQLSPAPQRSEDYCATKESERVPGPEVIRELSRFCVYEVEHKWPVQSKIPPPKSTELVRLDQDCASLVASGGPTDPSVESAEFLAKSRDFPAVTSLAAKPSTITNTNGVRLAFLDTQPTSEDPPEWQGRSPHGFVLAYIGKNLVCEGKRCAARITTRLALPIIDFNPKSWKLTQRDEVRGGYLGMQSDLAEAIRSEVETWQEHRRRGSSERHLVLNLSLAWEGELFGGLGEEQIAEMRAGTQAVYRALQYAAGFDALVLAAAGNKKAEPCSNFGPLLPAAWETGSARDENCREPRQPLLYAVGGLGADGSALVNARPGGIPRRAAYAENAVVPSPLAPQYMATLTGSSTPGYTATLTGSSVAAAVVSSIAAVVWAAFPEKSSSQIMEILDKSGEDMLVPADFWFGASAFPPAPRPNVHRLSLCPALQEACAEEGPTCHLQVQCDHPRRASSALPQPSDPRVWPGEHCQPWLSPQPESPPCPSCPP
jgi:hypothetical protein